VAEKVPVRIATGTAKDRQSNQSNAINNPP
jgi:hypothetical protein